jgi:hypothetical protein
LKGARPEGREVDHKLPAKPKGTTKKGRNRQAYRGQPYVLLIRQRCPVFRTFCSRHFRSACTGGGNKR